MKTPLHFIKSHNTSGAIPPVPVLLTGGRTEKWQAGTGTKLVSLKEQILFPSSPWSFWSVQKGSAAAKLLHILQVPLPSNKEQPSPGCSSLQDLSPTAELCQQNPWKMISLPCDLHGNNYTP